MLEVLHVYARLNYVTQYKPNWKIYFPDKRQQKILCLGAPLIFRYIAILNHNNNNNNNKMIKSFLATWSLKLMYK